MVLRKIFIALFLLLLLQFSSGAASAKTCYTPEEAVAEQALRIRNELMVIGLNCQHLADVDGENLYASYREFSRTNADFFAAYEKRLLTYFERVGAEKPEKALSKLSTSFANKIALNAANMRPDIFCARYAPRISKVIDMDKKSLKNWAETIYPGHPFSQPVCEQ